MSVKPLSVILVGSECMGDPLRRLYEREKSCLSWKPIWSHPGGEPGIPELADTEGSKMNDCPINREQFGEYLHTPGGVQKLSTLMESVGAPPSRWTLLVPYDWHREVRTPTAFPAPLVVPSVPPFVTFQLDRTVTEPSFRPLVFTPPELNRLKNILFPG